MNKLNEEERKDCILIKKKEYKRLKDIEEQYNKTDLKVTVLVADHGFVSIESSIKLESKLLSQIKRIGSQFRKQSMENMYDRFLNFLKDKCEETPRLLDYTHRYSWYKRRVIKKFIADMEQDLITLKRKNKRKL